MSRVSVEICLLFCNGTDREPVSPIVVVLVPIAGIEVQVVSVDIGATNHLRGPIVAVGRHVVHIGIGPVAVTAEDGETVE